MPEPVYYSLQDAMWECFKNDKVIANQYIYENVGKNGETTFVISSGHHVTKGFKKVNLISRIEQSWRKFLTEDKKQLIHTLRTINSHLGNTAYRGLKGTIRRVVSAILNIVFFRCIGSNVVRINKLIKAIEISIPTTTNQQHTFTSIKRLDSEKSKQVKEAIIQLIDKISEQPGIMDRLTSEEYDAFLQDDQSEGFSQIIEGQDQTLNGVIISRLGDRSFNRTEDTRICFIEKIAVPENLRKSGLGSRLLRKVAKMAIERQIHEIRLLVYKTSTNAINFYEHRGFEYVNKEADAPYKSFLLKIKPETLLQATSKKRASTQ